LTRPDSTILAMGRVGLNIRTTRWHNSDDDPKALASGLS
jgi:hypothetical protein